MLNFRTGWKGVWVSITLISSAWALNIPPESQVTSLGKCCEFRAVVKHNYSIRPKTTARLTYPVLATDDDTDYSSVFNRSVSELLQNEVTDFRMRSKQVIFSDQPEKKEKQSSDQFYLSADYSASAFQHANQLILSVRFSFLEAKKGQESRGLHFRSLNFDMKSGELLTLENFFLDPHEGLNLISEYVKDSLSDRLKDDSILNVHGLSANAEHFSVWNALPSGILFTFARGQVLPEDWGTQTVLIPYDVFDEYVDEDFPLPMCVKHPSWCRNKLLKSGGFSEM